MTCLIYYAFLSGLYYAVMKHSLNGYSVCKAHMLSVAVVVDQE